MFGGSPTQQAQPASASAGANLLGPAPAKAAAPSPVRVPDVQAPPYPRRDEHPWRGWGPVNREGGRDRDRDRRGHRGFQDHRHHSGANYSAVHDPTNRVLPWWLKQVGDELIQEDQSADFITGGSCLVVDTRDNRLVSPFQGLFPIEIHDNALNSINILTERSLLIQRVSGYELTLFSIVTINHYKLVVALSMDSTLSVPVAAWDSPTGQALSHPAFQPFTWPEMAGDTPTLVDLKLRFRGELLLHLEFLAYRSDTDMTVTRSQVNPTLLGVLQADSNEFQVQCCVFSGFKVSAISFEPGGRLYTCAAGGLVVATDVPRVHLEVRKTLRSCADAFGSDADKVEFRYRDGRELLVECRRMQVPTAGWIVASHISGVACPRICQLVIGQGGRIEAPDQGMQLGQLATIHERWFEQSIAEDVEDRVRADLIRTNIRVDSSPVSVHLAVDAQLRILRAEVVAQEALALSDHDQGMARMALFLPPSEGSGCRVAAAAPGAVALPVPIENLAYQPPAAMPKAHVVALAAEGARPRQVDDRHYIQRPVERSSLATKRVRAAEIEARERAKQLQFASS